MTNVSVYIAASVDGFIAREDGALDWLPGADGSGGDGEDYGYAEFVSCIDYLVMGRNSFEKVLSFGDWPYDIPVIVLSSRPIEIPKDLQSRVESMHAVTPQQVLEQLSARGAEHLYIDGGATIQRFLRAGLIDRLIVTCVPILLGQGIPLYGELTTDIHLKHIGSRSYPSGLVQYEYEVLRRDVEVTR